MTLEEKITHLQTAAMEQARAEGNAIIDSHRAALEKVFADHKKEAEHQAELRVREEMTRTKLALNQAKAKSQLEIKRRRGKVQQELKEKVFREAMELVREYMKTGAYDAFLEKCIRRAETYAGDDLAVIYLNPSDEGKKEELEEKTGVSLQIYPEDFIGGVRAEIQSRNILIDHSFQTQLRDEYEKFMFTGGDGNA